MPLDPDSGALAARSRNVLAVLDHVGTLQFSGENAAAFLQGQLTCDVDGLSPVVSTYGAYCSPKGRVLANFLLWRDAAGVFFMMLSRDILTLVQERLSMFVLRSRVKISDTAGALTLIGAAGPESVAAIGGPFFDLPRAPHEVRHQPAGAAIRLPDGRFVLACAAAQARTLQEQIAGPLRSAGASAWRWLDIRNGVPLVTAATQDQLVPQMANLELIGGISFTKGCYTGQEIVARTQHLGKVKRRMFLANVAARAAAGDSLYAEDLGNQVSGMIVNAEASPDGGHDVLAVVQVGSRENSTVHLESVEGPALRFLPLPYSVT
jgi:folate-binding protein YgfZ